MSRRGKDLLLVGLILALAAAVLAGSLAYRPASAYFPQALAIFMAAMAAGFGLRRLRDDGAAGETADGALPDGARIAGFAVVVAVVAGYAGLMHLAGFAVATAVFLAVSMALLGERNPLVLAGVALGLTAALHLLFFRFLGVAPPESILGF